MTGGVNSSTHHVILDIFVEDWILLFISRNEESFMSFQSITCVHTDLLTNMFVLSASPLKSHFHSFNNLLIIPTLIGFHIINTSRHLSLISQKVQSHYPNVLRSREQICHNHVFRTHSNCH